MFVLLFCDFRLFAEVLRRGEKEGTDMLLYWDSWDRHHTLKTAGLSPRIGRSRATRASVPSEESIAGYNNNNRGVGGGNIPPSSSVSSISSLNTHCVLGPPLTPPPQTRGKGTLFA